MGLKQESASFFAGVEALGVGIRLVVLVATAFTAVESELALSETFLRLEVAVELVVVLGPVLELVLEVVGSGVLDVLEFTGAELTSKLVVVDEGGGGVDDVVDDGRGGIAEDVVGESGKEVVSTEDWAPS